MEEGEIQDGGNGEENTEGRSRETEPVTPLMHVHGDHYEGAINDKEDRLEKENFNGDGGTRIENSENRHYGDSVFEMGHGPGTLSRKRPRKARSPEVWDTDMGDKNTNGPSHIRNLERSFDLNDTTQWGGDFFNELVNNLEAEQSRDEGGGLAGTKEGGSGVQDRGANDQENEENAGMGDPKDANVSRILEETADTLAVGAAVGFKLDGFFNKVSEVIIGEQMGLQ
ncbi:hypothetical protein Hanom_Chr04g00380891 [Helianthus anomalus]